MVYQLEMITNKETPGRVLQKRTREKVSRTYYVYGDNDGTQDYPTADASGYLMVWLQRIGGPAPKDGALPDEVWEMNENGKVIHYIWDLPDSALTGDDVDQATAHEQVEKLPICQSCYQVYAYNGRCGCT